MSIDTASLSGKPADDSQPQVDHEWSIAVAERIKLATDAAPNLDNEVEIIANIITEEVQALLDEPLKEVAAYKAMVEKYWQSYEEIEARLQKRYEDRPQLSPTVLRQITNNNFALLQQQLEDKYRELKAERAELRMVKADRDAALVLVGELMDPPHAAQNTENVLSADPVQKAKYQELLKRAGVDASARFQNAPAKSSTVTKIKNENAPKRYGLDAADFLSVEDEAEDPYIVQGLIPAGMPTLLVGPPKSRKSWIMLYLAICVAAGLPAFGRQTRQGRVLVIAREDTPRETRRRLRLIMADLGVTADQLRGWLRVDSSTSLFLDEQEDAEALAATLAEFMPSMCMIDSMSRVHSCNEDSKTEMAPVMNVWSELCSRYSCSVVLLHHTIKHWEGSFKLKNVRGTGDIVAVARVGIGVSVSAAGVSKIEVDGNLADMALPFNVSLRDVVKDGVRTAVSVQHSATPTIGGEGNIAAVQREHDEQIQYQILEQLFTWSGGVMTGELLRKGHKVTVADTAIAALKAAGLIESAMNGKKHVGYRITAPGKEYYLDRMPAVPPIPAQPSKIPLT